MRYHIKKNGNYKAHPSGAISPSKRNHHDLLVSQIIGVGATRMEERGLSVNHQLEDTPIYFDACESVPQAGVLFLLPFLEHTGLLSFKDHFQELKKGYYHITFIILFIAFMYLRRIKNPEQLKRQSPGEFGKIMGLDRVPEAKCLRVKIKTDMWTAKINAMEYGSCQVLVRRGRKRVLLYRWTCSGLQWI